MKKRILSIMTALALTIALLPAAVVPASAATRTVRVSDSKTFNDAIKDLRDGDTIQLTGSFVVTTPTSSNDSLFIGKNVTIDGQGNWLSLRYAGVLLGADVTFKEITLGLASNVRPALMANGHTLTLENVQRDPTNRNINLFCGGLTGGNQGGLSQGSHGQIIIKGNTNLGPTGRVFAGSISTDGQPNEFAKPATVTIDPSAKGDPIGELYACGALETPTSPDDWFNYEHEIAPPTPSADRFRVTGNVTFNLYGTEVQEVDGETGSDNYATVTYDDNSGYLNYNLVLTNIGDLNVRTGNLTPALGSSLLDSMPLAVASGATLGLQNLDNEVYVGNFSGGGSLVLGADQKLVVTGTVSGTTTVGIGGIFNGHSQEIPTVGNPYIDAYSSNADSFILAAPASRPDMMLTRSDTGAWTVTENQNTIIITDFELASAVVEANNEAILDFSNPSVTSGNANIPFVMIDLIISVNGTTLDGPDLDQRYSKNGFTAWVAEGNTATEGLAVYGANQNTYLGSGTYVISVTVPASNSGTGKPITRTATLTVKAAGGSATVIPEPQAPTGLVFNGEEQVGVPIGGAYEFVSGTASATDVGNYTVTVKPASGFTWEGGGNGAKTINWTIAKADNPNPLPRLEVTAPTTYGGKDGTITGTDAGMEYADNSSFAGARSCGEGETAGLAAGDYYVRIAESTNYKAGSAVMVTVPQGPVTVQSITITSTDHKTQYTVGEPLDVNGLTLTVTMSNNSEYLVPVAAGMVSGFNSESPVESQTLTITYGGHTVSYDITIAENPGPTDPTDPGPTNPDPTDPDDPSDPAGPIAVTGVTLNKSAATLTVGSSERLTATVSPDNAANKNVTWASQNTAAATVDAGGTVTAVSAGTAVITVTTEDGGKTASCTVTVSPNGGGEDSSSSSSSEDSGFSSNTTTNTTTNADGSVITTVTDKRTGTVTTTTRKPDGSTTVVEAKKDGTVTITDTAKNGVKAETTSKPGADTSARVTLPTSVQAATVTLPAEVTPGTVAVDAKTGKIVKLSVASEAGMVVKLDASAELILEDRSKAFTDTDGHWAESAIDFTTAHALFNGTSDTTFAPDEPMTRGMVAVVLHNFEGNPDSAGQNGFADVASGTWYTDAINWITGKGIAGGYGNGSFGTNDVVTREQLVTFLYRYAGAMGYSTEGGADLSAFPDGASVSAYAAEAMRWAVGSGLITGTDKGALAPGSSATRAQVAAILNRFVVNLMK